LVEHRSGFSREDILLVLLLLLVAAGIFGLDLLIPLGVAAGVPYIAVVFLGARLPWRHSIVTMAATGTVLTLLGYLFSESGSIAWMVFFNRALALLAIWLTAFVLLQRRRAEQALKAERDGFEARVVERTAQLGRTNVDLQAQIARRREAERELEDRRSRLQAIMESAADGIITIDERGLIESFNSAAGSLFGYTSGEVIGRNVNILMPEPWRGEHDGYLKRYLDTGEASIIGIGPQELGGLRKDGTQFPMDLAISEMSAGGRRQFIGMVRDISERKQQQAELQQAQKMEAVGQLTGGVAHDFNNLLAIIIGNLELQGDTIRDNEPARKFADTAAGAAERGADLTRRLLAFSRKQPLSPGSINANQLLPDVTELMRRALGKDIEVELVLGGGLWNAMMDQAQLENALLNLAINSRDAMPDGGKLTIETANVRLDREYASTRQEVTPGQYVMVAVSDTGTGMPPGVLDRIFEPFFTTKEVGKGTGLGLSMVYGFIKQSNGHLAIYSEVGEGTTVRLYLPRAKESDATRPAAVRRPETMPTGDEVVLVVEDDPDVRAFLAASLGTLGYTVIEAEDGPAALALLDGKPRIDLLLADVVLPRGMNGREVAEAVRGRYPEIGVLFTSGYTENAVIHHGKVDEAVELLSKPYTRQTLARRVRQVLDERED